MNQFTMKPEEAGHLALEVLTLLETMDARIKELEAERRSDRYVARPTRAAVGYGDHEDDGA